MSVKNSIAVLPMLLSEEKIILKIKNNVLLTKRYENDLE